MVEDRPVVLGVRADDETDVTGPPAFDSATTSTTDDGAEASGTEFAHADTIRTVATTDAGTATIDRNERPVLRVSFTVKYRHDERYCELFLRSRSRSAFAYSSTHS